MVPQQIVEARPGKYATQRILGRCRWTERGSWCGVRGGLGRDLVLHEWLLDLAEAGFNASARASVKLNNMERPLRSLCSEKVDFGHLPNHELFGMKRLHDLAPKPVPKVYVL